jgi:IS30 family transposase
MYNLTCMLKGKKFTQLRERERITIEVLLNQGLSYSEISRALSRPVSTISREVRRNGPGVYKAGRAQCITDKRHRHKPKHVVFDRSMRSFIARRLQCNKWSPELISVKGKQQRSDFISAEWIYQWIWAMKFSQRRSDKKYQPLFKYLKHACRRRKRGRKRNMRGNIIGRKWIEHRPRAVDKRSRRGDMEADIILGRNRKPGLLVLLDRRSRKTWLHKLKVKDAAVVMNKLINTCQKVGDVKTITFDNDQSFAQHYRLNKIGIDTFFTHPYSSQEKGSVENRIGIVRMFFNKKTDFTQVTSAQVKSVENKINNRPLRLFKYRSPNEVHIS